MGRITAREGLPVARERRAVARRAMRALLAESVRSILHDANVSASGLAGCYDPYAEKVSSLDDPQDRLDRVDVRVSKFVLGRDYGTQSYQLQLCDNLAEIRERRSLPQDAPLYLL